MPVRPAITRMSRRAASSKNSSVETGLLVVNAWQVVVPPASRASKKCPAAVARRSRGRGTSAPRGRSSSGASRGAGSRRRRGCAPAGMDVPVDEAGQDQPVRDVRDAGPGGAETSAKAPKSAMMPSWTTSSPSGRTGRPPARARRASTDRRRSRRTCRELHSYRACHRRPPIRSPPPGLAPCEPSSPTIYHDSPNVRRKRVCDRHPVLRPVDSALVLQVPAAGGDITPVCAMRRRTGLRPPATCEHHGSDCWPGDSQRTRSRRLSPPRRAQTEEKSAAPAATAAQAAPRPAAPTPATPLLSTRGARPSAATPRRSTSSPAPADWANGSGSPRDAQDVASGRPLDRRRQRAFRGRTGKWGLNSLTIADLNLDMRSSPAGRAPRSAPSSSSSAASRPTALAGASRVPTRSRSRPPWSARNSTSSGIARPSSTTSSSSASASPSRPTTSTTS